MNILFIIGTRPEAIKMAPVIQKFKNDQNNFITKVCVTAQHREMLDQVLNFFEIKPDYDLDLMKKNQNLYNLTSSIILNLKSVLDDFNPDYVFVHGDTTTTMAASLSSFYHGSKVVQIEAGLRTFNKKSPFPEEINRQIVSRISDFHFAPTKISAQNLIKENIKKSKIIITGNTVIDSLLKSIKKIEKKINSKIVNLFSNESYKNKKIILVTSHRRENHGKGFINICDALLEISKNRNDIVIVFPVHPNPSIKNVVNSKLVNNRNILLIDPLSYPDFIWLMNKSKIIISDSGGVQEEAPSLGKPVLVLRDTTERPEAVNAGTVILVGTSKEKICSETYDLLDNISRYKNMSLIKNPYGDGTASDKIYNFFKKLI